MKARTRRRRRTKKRVGVYIHGRDATALLDCKTRTQAQQVRRVLAAWEGRRDADTLLRLANFTLRRAARWTRTIIEEFEHRNRGAR